MGDPEVYSAQNTDNETLPCLIRCNRQSETVTVTSGLFPNEMTFQYRKDICLVLQKVARICTDKFRNRVVRLGLNKSNLTCKDILNANNTLGFCNENDLPHMSIIESYPNLTNFLFKYAQKNFAKVNILIRDSFYTRIIRDEEISLVTFLGDTGGLLGLFLGVSLISFFEVFYFCLDVAIVKMYKSFALTSRSREKVSTLSTRE
jgi:hypothetical protein